MIDNNTVVIFGWKVTDNNIEKLQNELEAWDEDYFDKIQDILIEDTMCGNYIYFGAILAQYDAGEGGEVIIDSKLIKKATDTYNKKIKNYPEVDKILSKYAKKKAKLYVFQQIW